MKRRFLLVIVAASSLLVGCERGPTTGKVTGIVTQNDQPLPMAMIEFQPDSGAPSYAYTDETGAYELSYQPDRKGALLGHHRVSVTTGGEGTDPETEETIRIPEKVPAEYNDETTLEYDVKKGKNEFNIAIKGERERKGRRRRRSP